MTARTAALAATLALALATAAAGCGGEEQRTAANACDGLKVGSPQQGALLFGAIDKLTRRRMCADLGRPQRVTDDGSRERWTYPTVEVVYDADRDAAIDLR